MRARRIGAIVVVVALCALPAGGSAATLTSRAQVFTGYGFDTCAAPPLSTLSAWQASPYRAIGIYLGGVNRACGDGHLSTSWVASAVAAGWALAPLYVGRQAPCVSQSELVHIDADRAPDEGVAAADDAAGRAAAFGLPAGSPIYFDMEGYAVDDPGCTQIVQAFLSGWTGELHALGYLAGVYGSAASTMRDVVAVAGSGGATVPDAIWIAHWNGLPTVFGDSFVPDTLWTSHQRLHQYAGGHRESYGGVELEIDGDYVDGPVVAAAGPPAPPTPPTPPPAPPPAPTGSVGSGDGEAVASWPAGAFAQSVLITLTPVPVEPPLPGLGAGYAARLAATDTATGTALTAFAQPVTIAFKVVAPGAVPVASSDGASWHLLPRLAAAALPSGVSAGYTVEPDGTTDVLTLAPGLFGLFRDASPPTQPKGLAGRFSHGSLILAWRRSTDNSRVIATYRITLDGRELLSVPGSARRATVHAFHPDRATVYRVIAVDRAGNAGERSAPVVVVPAPRPQGIPRHLPAWVWSILAWQQHHRTGPRPAAPRPLPDWYWRWAAWRLQPFRVKG